MKPVAPPHLPELTDDTGWTWGAIGASLITHVLLMLAIVGISQREAEAPSRRAAEPDPITRYVELPPLPPEPEPVAEPGLGIRVNAARRRAIPVRRRRCVLRKGGHRSGQCRRNQKEESQ